MKQVKKYVIILLLVGIALLGKNVKAEEVYYTNQNGVSFTREQYDFYTYLTHDGFQEYVTQEMLDEIANEDLTAIEYGVTRICPMPMGMGNMAPNNPLDDTTFVTTSAKSLSMAYYCTEVTCRAMSEVEWFGEPSVKSYDVYGSYIDGPTRTTTPSTFVTSSLEFGSHETIKYDTNGYGAIVQVPDGDEIIISQMFNFQGTGTIFFSYQHAMSYITLSNSQLFNIDLIGYGSVFDFYGAAANVYDDMPGVHMDV